MLRINRMLSSLMRMPVIY